MPPAADSIPFKNDPETINIVPAEDTIKFHDPPIHNRMGKLQPDMDGQIMLSKYAVIAGVASLSVLGLFFLTFLVVRNYKSQSKKNPSSKSKSQRKSLKKEKEKKSREKKSERKRERRDEKRRKAKSQKREQLDTPSTSPVSASDPSTDVNSSGDSPSSVPETKIRKKKVRKHKYKDSDFKALKKVKMVPLTERHPTKASLRAINRQLTARSFFENQLKTLRDGSERERMLKALREMQVTTHWPELKTEDLSTESLDAKVSRQGHTALSPFINYQRPRLMKNPATPQSTRFRSCRNPHDQADSKSSNYRYKDSESMNTRNYKKPCKITPLRETETIIFKPARVQDKITTKSLEDFFNLERLSEWQQQQSKADKQADTSESSSDSLRLGVPVGRKVSDDESYIMYSRDANPRRIRERSILNARPTPPEPSEESSSPTTPEYVRKTLANRTQSRTVRFDRFTKRYIF